MLNCRYLCGMKEYWYLREGDFLPETIDSICKNWKRSRRSVVEFLSANANIFTSREDAEQASRVVRAALIAHHVRQGQVAEIRTAVDIPPYEDG